MDFFHNNIKRGYTDLKGYDLPKSVHDANKYSKNKDVYNDLDKSVIKSRGKSKFYGLISYRKFGI